MQDNRTPPVVGGASERVRRLIDWSPDPAVAGVVAVILTRAAYVGPGMDGRARFQIDGGDLVTLTREGVRRLLGHQRCRTLPPGMVSAVRRELQVLADAVQVELTALAVVRSCEAYDVAVAAAADEAAG